VAMTRLHRPGPFDTIEMSWARHIVSMVASYHDVHADHEIELAGSTAQKNKEVKVSIDECRFGLQCFVADLQSRPTKIV
jgi:hypothetical protein